MPDGATQRTGTAGTTGFAMLLGCLCGGHGSRLLLLVLLLSLGCLLLLLLLLCLLGLSFPFLFGQLAVAFLSFACQFRVRRWLKLEIRTTAGVVVTTVTSANEYRRL